MTEEGKRVEWQGTAGRRLFVSHRRLASVGPAPSTRVAARSPLKAALLMLAFLTAASAAVPAHSVAASPPGADQTFCQPQSLQGYVPLLADLPGTRQVPISTEMSFDSDIIFSGKPRELISVGNGISYQLMISSSSPQVSTPKFEWRLFGRLNRVDRTGKTLEAIARLKRGSGGILKSAPTAVRYGQRLQPGLYRSVLTFVSPTGTVLSRFREYYRVVRKTFERTRLQLDDHQYKRGETVFARIVILGAEPVTFDSDFVLEKYETGEDRISGWRSVYLYDTSTPPGPYVFPMGRWTSQPGTMGPCGVAYTLPTYVYEPKFFPALESGVYRLVKPLEGDAKDLVSDQFEVNEN